MIIKLFLTNVFSDGMFTGGKAAVAILRHLGQEKFLQGLAAELNAPVTAYVLPFQNRFAVRYFTPTQEVTSSDFGALAVARVLLNCGLTPMNKPVKIEGRSEARHIIAMGDDNLALMMRASGFGEELAGLEKEAAVAAGFDPDELWGAQAGGRDTLIVYGRSRAWLENIDWAAGSIIKGAGRLLATAPGTDSDSYEYFFRYFSAEGESDEPLSNLEPLVVAGSFWSRQIGDRPIGLRRLGPRGAYVRMEFRGENPVQVISQTKIIFKGEPLISELTANTL